MSEPIPKGIVDLISIRAFCTFSDVVSVDVLFKAPA